MTDCTAKRPHLAEQISDTGHHVRALAHNLDLLWRAVATIR
ncbi:MAG: hypothetical protein AAFY15_01010 [Cyanobacteria bacterium J06648_11]